MRAHRMTCSASHHLPAVHRTYYDGRISHVTGIVNITAEDYKTMPPRFRRRMAP
jgi:hypothetical protein